MEKKELADLVRLVWEAATLQFFPTPQMISNERASPPSAGQSQAALSQLP